MPVISVGGGNGACCHMHLFGRRGHGRFYDIIVLRRHTLAAQRPKGSVNPNQPVTCNLNRKGEAAKMDTRRRTQSNPQTELHSHIRWKNPKWKFIILWFFFSSIHFVIFKVNDPPLTPHSFGS